MLTDFYRKHYFKPCTPRHAFISLATLSKLSGRFPLEIIQEINRRIEAGDMWAIYGKKRKQGEVIVLMGEGLMSPMQRAFYSSEVFFHMTNNSKVL